MKNKSIREELAYVREMLTGGPDCVVGMSPLVTSVYDRLGVVIERLNNLPAVAWSIGHDENGEDGIITREAGHAQNWRDRCREDNRLDNDSVLALYPLDWEPRND